MLLFPAAERFGQPAKACGSRTAWTHGFIQGDIPQGDILTVNMSAK